MNLQLDFTVEAYLSKKVSIFKYLKILKTHFKTNYEKQMIGKASWVKEQAKWSINWSQNLPKMCFQISSFLQNRLRIRDWNLYLRAGLCL
jgi:hypothetical protein